VEKFELLETVIVGNSQEFNSQRFAGLPATVVSSDEQVTVVTIAFEGARNLRVFSFPTRDLSRPQDGSAA
jgi:hypothetical protein